MLQPRPLFHSSLRTSAILPTVHRQSLLRHTSTTTAQSHSRPSTASRWTRRLLYAGIFGSLGVYAGTRLTGEGWLPLTPGSAADRQELQRLEQMFDVGIPIVQELRRDPDYVETQAYMNYDDETRPHRLTSGPMAGSRGLGLQKIFWNDKTKNLICVVYLGCGIEGWPRVVHGGALGTVIDESLGRAAIRHFPARTGVTANLDIHYRAPVFSGNFYTLHSTVDQSRSTDRKAFATCEVRDLGGRVCVEASGIFVVPKRLQLERIGEEY
ncbi:hypothetical protein N7474_002389 [Penicillium riverlandense]|uniref:uncharacterized protein n=1 Tax=Penicillium riverlandense TaxID=1903569 RepID=UPI0025499D92|nr:uncharacterized protein N7474_002389 [Penicillium riverlandense]KAJ5825251.1 hypothetical protein N7474_002389 [Penicillium riverlandense]